MDGTVASQDEASSEGAASGMDRRQALRRLAVGGAIVWTAPLISKTALAAGPTSCTNRVLDWNGFTTNSTFSNTNVGGVTVTLAPSTFFGGTTALSTNRTIRSGPQGGINGQGLRFEQTPINNGGQVITLNFSQTVYAVDFTVTDIDNYFASNGDGWSDRIEVVSPASYTSSVPSGSNVIGSGTASGNTNTTGRFRNSNANNNYPNSSNAGNVNMFFPGPLTQIVIHFRCASTDAGSNQLINVMNIGFCS